MKTATHDKDNYIVLNKIKSSDKSKNDMMLLNADDGSLSFAYGVVENDDGMTWDKNIGFQEEVQNLHKERRHRKR